VEYLTVTEVLLIHARLIQRTGGSKGLSSMALLESAVGRPQASYGGTDLYPDVWSKAAALMHSLIRNHPFVDGNKRTALTAATVFLELNDQPLTATNDQVLAFTQRAASGGIDVSEMAEWLRARTQPPEED